MPGFKLQWDYSGSFLSDYPRSAQSTIANIFCNAVRDGASDVESVLRWIGRDINRRLDYGGTAAVTDEVLYVLQAAIEGQEAHNFASFILWRESLPAAERERLKNAKGRAFAVERMAGESPTDKQLAFLQSLGCPTIPKSKLEASQLIERWKGGGR